MIATQYAGGGWSGSVEGLAGDGREDSGGNSNALVTMQIGAPTTPAGGTIAV